MAQVEALKAKLAAENELPGHEVMVTAGAMSHMPWMSKQALHSRMAHKVGVPKLPCLLPSSPTFDMRKGQHGIISIPAAAWY